MDLKERPFLQLALKFNFGIMATINPMLLKLSELPSIL